MPTLADILGGSTFTGLLNTGANFALTQKGIEDLRSAGSTLQSNLGALANQMRQDTTFKPYTVTTGGGTGTMTPEGTSTALSPELQSLVSQLTGSATGMFGQAGQPIDARALETTAALEAAAAPSRERERLALEERLLGQGRLGVRTSMFGGTPEQLALAKAIEEQRLNNVLMGRQQALTEQQQAYDLGAGMLGQSFLPQQFLNQSLQAATPFAELRTRLGLQGAVTGAELGTQAAQVGINTEQLANALRQQQLQGVLNSIFGTSSTGGLLSSIFNRATQSGNTQSDNDYFANIARILGEL